MQCRHRMPFGAELGAGSDDAPGDEPGVHFRLWAPSADSVDLAFYPLPGGPADFVPAQSEPGGWWECNAAEALPGSLYQWRIDGTQLVPDPASRQNPMGVHGPSCVVDPLQFKWDADWQGRPWNEVVLYELHVGTFTEEGTFSAAAEQLADLAKLGITAVELMPIASFPGRFGWGYDGVLPFAPFEGYGTPDELKHFVQQAHRLGLMVFLDVVYNHFGPDGNYLGTYAKPFFSAERQSPWGAALDFEGPDSAAVRDFFVHNALYWIEEYRIDGLRLDAVHAIADKSEPDIVARISEAVRAANPRRHVHLVLEDENNTYGRLAVQPLPGRFDGQWNDDFHHALRVVLTGDSSGYFHDYGSQPLDLLARALTHGMLFEGSPRRPGGAREECREAPPQPLGTLVHYTQNHDQVGNRPYGERLPRLVAPEASGLATLLALLTPATPMLFAGEEFGATTPFLYFADWEDELRDAVRAGRRAEFGHAEKETPLPDPCSEETFEDSRLSPAEAASAAGRGRRELVRQALAVRKAAIAPRQAALQHGQHESQRVGATGIEIRWHYAEGASLVLQANLGAEAIDGLPAPEGKELLRYRWGAEAHQEARHWPAWGARWLQCGPAE